MRSFLAVPVNLRRSALVLLALMALAVALVPAPAAAASPAEHTIHISAASFQYDPAVVWVNQGDRVTFVLEAQDVVHGLYLDGYDLNVTADPGRPASLTFTADRAGSFRFRCSVTCGALHPFMIGKLNVGTNWLLWRGLALTALALVAGLWVVRT